MKVKKSLFLLLLLALSFSSFAQNVSIRGTIENAEQKTIRLLTPNDLISDKENQIGELLIKRPQDSFSFQLSTNYPIPVTVQIERYRQTFFVEPNKDYAIHIPEFDWSRDEKQNIHLNPIYLPILFDNLDSNDLNLLLNNFDSLYGSLINTYSKNIFIKKNQKTADTIKNILLAAYPEQSNSYFNDYLTYRLAAIELAAGKSKKALGMNYIENKPILYRHVAYMDFFNLYFRDFFTDGTKTIRPEKVRKWVNEMNLFTLIDSLGTEPILKNEQIRELCFLLGMNEALYKQGYHAESVLDLLKKVADETKFNEHRTIAEGILAQYKQKVLKQQDYSFSLPDIDKHLRSLDSFKGKWVYLNFVRLKEQISLRELASLSFYYDSLKKNYDIEFITICCDREFQVMFHFLKNSKDGDRYQWVWLHFNGDYDLLDTYQVTSFPSFALFDPEGKLVQLHAKSPKEGFFIRPPFPPKKQEEKNIEE